MKTLTEYIKESMLKHLAIEMHKYDLVYEKYGLYDGCKELVNYIKDKLRQIESFEDIIINYDDVKNIDNIVFDKLILTFEDSNELSASYKAQRLGNINPETKRFTQVVIEFKLKFNIYNYKISCELDGIIGHELTHMYNDYLIQCIGNKSFFDLFNNVDYERSKYFRNTKYHPDLRKFLRALYMLNDYERNGFIATLAIQIDQIKEKYKREQNVVNVPEIFAEVRGLDVYKHYMEIITFIECYKQDALYRKDKEQIKEEWKRNFNEDIDIDKIFKRLENKIVKLKRKLESIIPKRIAEAMNNDHNKIIIW